MGLRKTIFGRQKAKFNTFLGGVSNTISTPALLASRLGITVNRIKNFRITDSDISAEIIGGNYTIPLNAFKNDIAITYYYDNVGLVTAIGTSAFSGCSNLTGANFKNWTATNGSGTFMNCPKLKDVDFSSLKSITHSSTFYNNSSIESSSFNWVALTALGDATFQGSGISGSIVLNMSGRLGNNCFVSTKITSFIGNNLTEIGFGAFRACDELMHVEANSVTTIYADTTNYVTFQNVPCPTYNFPSLLTIGNSAFDGNTFVQSFTANSLKNMGGRVFFGASNLSICNISNIEVLGSRAFHNCAKLPSFSDSTFDKVSLIPYDCFYGCNNILFNRIVFNNATNASAAPFNLCSNLESIIAPKLKTIDNQFLFGLSIKLKNVEISNAESIGTEFMQAFGNYTYTSLLTINIPKCTSFTGSPSILKNMFVKAKNGIIINVNIAMSINNSGTPDFDLQWAVTNRSAIINYIT